MYFYLILQLSRKLEGARKKAELVSDNLDMTDKERSSQIKSIYKRAGLLGKKKPEVKYIVAKKGTRGRTLAKSKGVKGPYKVVDSRMKKDKKAEMRKAKKTSGKGRGKGRGGNKGKSRQIVLLLFFFKWF